MAENLGASFSIDVTNLKSGLAQANRLIRESQSEFKAAAAGMDDWRKSEEGLTARIKSLNTQNDVHKKKISALKDEYKHLEADGLDPTDKQMVELRTKINKETETLNKNEKEIKENKDALKELSNHEKNAGDEAEKSSEKMKKIGSVAGGIAKVAVGAFAAVGAGVVALGKKAIGAYSDYEQLVGGVETLFGTGEKNIEEYAKSVGKSVDGAKKEYNRLNQSQQLVISNANDAYKTAGLSANDYMETVTSFSASLLQGLNGDTKKAAKIADLAITDMSDNANKMGTDMEAIQNAYQGFAKGNYTMLDNLKLGYGGTKTEMLRLVKDAGVVDKSVKSIDDVSYDQIIKAIHIVQDDMGITGTTAREAATTIQGSATSMKTAWENLVTGIADDNADFDSLINNFVESVMTFGDNIIPRIETTIGGIGNLVSGLLEKLVPKIIDMVPPLLQKGFPIIISTVEVLIDSIIKVLPGLVTLILQFLPELINVAVSLILALADGISTALPMLIPVIIDVVMKICDTLLDNLPVLIESGLSIILALLAGIIKALPKLLAYMPKLISKMISAAGKSLSKFGNFGKMLLSALIKPFSGIGKTFSNIWKAVTNSFKSIGTKVGNAIGGAFKNAINSVLATAERAINFLPNTFNKLLSVINELPGVTIGKMNTVDLPRLAKGGVVSEATHAIIGEGRGNEAVLPLSDKKAMKQIVDALYNAGGGSGHEIVVNQTNNFSKAHSHREMYESKRATEQIIRRELKKGFC